MANLKDKVAVVTGGGSGIGSMERIREQSFYWYKKIIASNGEALK